MFAGGVCNHPLHIILIHNLRNRNRKAKSKIAVLCIQIHDKENKFKNVWDGQEKINGECVCMGTYISVVRGRIQLSLTVEGEQSIFRFQ